MGAKLAGMLVSRHVTHLRDEVVQCAGQLSRIEEILSQVQVCKYSAKLIIDAPLIKTL